MYNNRQAPDIKTKELSQNANSAAVLLLCPDIHASAVAWAIFMFLGTTKPALPQKQSFLWKSFQFETAMLPEYQKDGFVSGRFPVSSTTFSN